MHLQCKVYHLCWSTNSSLFMATNPLDLWDLWDLLEEEKEKACVHILIPLCTHMQVYTIPDLLIWCRSFYLNWRKEIPVTVKVYYYVFLAPDSLNKRVLCLCKCHCKCGTQKCWPWFFFLSLLFPSLLSCSFLSTIWLICSFIMSFPIIPVTPSLFSLYASLCFFLCPVPD